MPATSPHSPRLAYFISPHGFGHAARAAAVMAALQDLNPSLTCDIYTTVPEWFFADSLEGSFTYKALLTDIGFVQKTPLLADIEKTMHLLNAFFPLDRSGIHALADKFRQRGCQMVVCDIAPMGIAAAREAGIPSVLIENFTWDWLYEGYLEEAPQMDRHIAYLRELFESADFHIQTVPLCSPEKGDLTTRPIRRRPRTSPEDVREKLGIPMGAKMVLVTMGGIPSRFPFLDQLKDYRNVFFVISGGSDQARVHENLVLLPQRSAFFHPDLVDASDAVIGKAGYSTIAEVYFAGVPFGYVPRKGFRESEVLESFIRKEMRGVCLDETGFHEGTWLQELPGLLDLAPVERRGPWGVDQAARFLDDLLSTL